MSTSQARVLDTRPRFGTVSPSGQLRSVPVHDTPRLLDTLLCQTCLGPREDGYLLCSRCIGFLRLAHAVERVKP